MVTQLFSNFIRVGNEVIGSVNVAVTLLELCVSNQNTFNITFSTTIPTPSTYTKTEGHY